MEARDSFCFPKNTKNPNPFPIGKKFGFCCCGAPPGTRTLGPLIKRAGRGVVSKSGSFDSSSFLHKAAWFFSGNFCTSCRILQRKAPSVRSETVQKPCRNRALTLRQTKSPYSPPTWRHWFAWPQIRASNIETLPFHLKTFSTASLKHTDGFPRGGERRPHCTHSSSKKDARFITITNYYLYETTPAVHFGKVVSNL